MSADEEIRKLRAEVQGHQTITEMIAGVTHDLATPLGIMNQAASIIADEVREKTFDALAKDDDARETLEDVAEAARLILSSAARARELLATFKNLAVRELTDKKETVDIDALLGEVVGLYRFKARANKLDIVVDGLSEGDTQWESYPGHLTRVLLNLLSNIDRYAYPDGEGGRVDVKLERDDAGYLIRVSDHGAGMSEEHLGKVFQAFFTTGQNKGGTGLGMAIVHDLVTRALGGTIDIASELDKGTRVEIRLPRTTVGNVEKESKV
jgi:signal transduction histidine kinase